MQRGRLLAYAATALVLGAALAIMLLTPQDDDPASTQDTAPPPMPSAPPAPEPQRTVIYDASIPTSNVPNRVEGRHVFPVRAGDHDLAVRVVMTPGDPMISIALEDPRGTEIDRCRGGICNWTVADPAVGLWRFVVPGQLGQRIEVNVTIVREATPLPEEEIYSEERIVPATRPSSSWEDAFIVEAGHDMIEVGLGVSGNAGGTACVAGTSVTIVSPTGRQVGVQSPGGRFALFNAAPGRYLLQYSVGPCSQVLGTVTARAT